MLRAFAAVLAVAATSAVMITDGDNEDPLNLAQTLASIVEITDPAD